MTSSWTAHPRLASPTPPGSAAERHPSDRGHGRWIFVLGPRWVRAPAVAHGPQRSLAVSNGSDEPQVIGPSAHAAESMRAGDSDCGPEGRRLGLALYVRRLATRAPTHASPSTSPRTTTAESTNAGQSPASATRAVMKFTTMTAAVKPASGTATRRTDRDRRPARNPVASSSTVSSVCSMAVR
jgi:hypothetical protein